MEEYEKWSENEYSQDKLGRFNEEGREARMNMKKEVQVDMREEEKGGLRKYVDLGKVT